MSYAYKLTRAERDHIVDLVDRHTRYDRATVRISRTGMVVAKLDPDKVPGCGDLGICFVGYYATDFGGGRNPFVP